MADAAESLFSDTYHEARARFNIASTLAGWSNVAHRIEATGPQGEPLTIDVASSASEADRTLLITSGVHGVEGRFGSAIQLDLLQHAAAGRLSIPDGCRIVLVHAVNPYGFAHDRRADAANIDLNRNFLLPGQEYKDSPPGYFEVDRLLNPRNVRTRSEAFRTRMIWNGCMMGFAALKSAIASGQYEYPRGLFYGGSAPAATNPLIEREFPVWVPPGCDAALHIDLHSGLGHHASSTLLTDISSEDRKLNPLAQGFAAAEISAMHAGQVAYPALGTMTAWTTARHQAARFHAWGLEFGAYPGLHTLAALRDENRQHFYGDPYSSDFRRAKAQLREVFCPANPRWRSAVIHRAGGIIRRALQTLERA